MANVDTENKRRSVDQMPGLEIYLSPSGAVDVSERADASAIYSGLSYGVILLTFLVEAETGYEYYPISDKFISKAAGAKIISFASLPAMLFEVETGEPFTVLNNRFISKSNGGFYEH